MTTGVKVTAAFSGSPLIVGEMIRVLTPPTYGKATPMLIPPLGEPAVGDADPRAGVRIAIWPSDSVPAGRSVIVTTEAPVQGAVRVLEGSTAPVYAVGAGVKTTPRPAATPLRVGFIAKVPVIPIPT